MQLFFSRVFILLLFCFVNVSLFAQQPTWRTFDETRIQASKQSSRQIMPNVYKTQAISFKSLRTYLNDHLNAKSDQLIFEVPRPDGESEHFEIALSNVFSDGLAAKYPSIKTYKGTSIDGTATIHLGLSPKGFHAMVLSNRGSYFIDNYLPSNQDLYQVYFRKDYDQQTVFQCLVEDSANELIEENNNLNVLAGDCQLRRYRLALACTGEYATFHGGTVESVLAEYAVAMARVNGIYERDNGITMELIENTDDVIFLNGATDPYTNNSGGTMLGENQATLDDIIGPANYDIGHVFSTGGGGIAGLQTPCGNGKARGVTGLGSPVNDPFYVDYVSHEIGHQFGANHTQNNDCNRNNATAMEPGSANTIMGYAGICSPNTANNSDDHFHAISIQEIANFIVSGNGATCAEYVDIENAAPEISVEHSMYNLPIGTPFKLEAMATDANNVDLSYCWEQMDNEVATMPPVNTNDRGPAFISRPPVPEPYRYFPNIIAIINNQIPTWEVVPFVEREMSFICTVRDNNAILGCTDEVMVDLNFNEDAGPFLVMHPNTNVTWNSADTEEVTWDVAGTADAPVSCALVDIYLSIDGGFTYPILIEAQVENDGSHNIVVPGVNTDDARIMVKCSDNIFFDISDEDFTIKSPFSISLSKEESSFCEAGIDSVILNTEAFDGFDESLSVAFLNVPDGVNISASNDPISPPESSTIYIENVNAIPGTYPITVQVISSVITLEQTIEIDVISSTIIAPVPQTPENGATDIMTDIELFWNATDHAESYEIVISTSPDFSVAPAIINILNGSLSTSISGLEEGTVYYWKVQASNACIDGPDSETYAFQTAQSSCQLIAANDLQIEIPANSNAVINHQIDVSGISFFDFIRVSFDMDHTWLGDIKTTITSPQGTEAILFDQIGVPASQYGCDQDDMILQFFDSSINTAEELEETCGNFADNYQSVDPLSIYNEENVNGVWDIEIQDFFAQDGGELDSWALEFCTVGINTDAILSHNPLVLNQGATKNVSKIHLDMANSADDITMFTIRSLPAHGMLEVDLENDGSFEQVSIGTIFSEQDISDNLIRYTHDGGDEMMDAFFYDALDENNGWSNQEKFDIQISDGSLTAFAVITEDILCFGGHNGIISVEVVGGLEPYQYSIDGQNFQDESIFTNLTAGDYEITVLDANGQEVLTDLLKLVDPDPIIATSNLDFYNIEVDAEGGTPGYTYSLDGQNYQESNVFVKPGNGSYTVFVKDANGCIESAFITVDIAALELGLNVTAEVECFGDQTGAIQTTGVGGYEPYEYSIDGNNFSDQNTFENLPAGMYTMYIRDAGGLITTAEITIDSPEQIILNGNFANNVLNLDGMGGTGNLEYSIDGTNYGSEQSFDDYGVQPFTANVRDENGCIVSVELTPLYAELDVDEIECFGDNNGRIESMTQGGSTMGYEYSLDNVSFQSEPVFDGLTPGDYTVYIRDDANNTYTSEQISLIEPEELTATVSFDGNDLITVMAEGGTGTIFYSFDGGSTFKDINTYTWMGEDALIIYVKDANGCEIELNYSVVNNKELEALDWKIYPNPANDQLTIQWSDQATAGKWDVLLLNHLGQKVMEKQCDQNTMTMSTLNLPEGLYHVMITHESQRFSQKVVIVHP